MINGAELQCYCSLMIVNGFVQTIVSKYLIIGNFIVIIIILSYYMSGNSQGVKRHYLDHKIILCNTLLWAPGPILMAPDSFYLTNTSRQVTPSHPFGQIQNFYIFRWLFCKNFKLSYLLNRQSFWPNSKTES